MSVDISDLLCQQWEGKGMERDTLSFPIPARHPLGGGPNAPGMDMGTIQCPGVSLRAELPAHSQGKRFTAVFGASPEQVLW